jgi:hypothetical protein
MEPSLWLPCTTTFQNRISPVRRRKMSPGTFIGRYRVIGSDTLSERGNGAANEGSGNEFSANGS